MCDALAAICLTGAIAASAMSAFAYDTINIPEGVLTIADDAIE